MYLFSSMSSDIRVGCLAARQDCLTSANGATSVEMIAGVSHLHCILQRIGDLVQTAAQSLGVEVGGEPKIVVLAIGDHVVFVCRNLKQRCSGQSSSFGDLQYPAYTRDDGRRKKLPPIFSSLLLSRISRLSIKRVLDMLFHFLEAIAVDSAAPDQRRLQASRLDFCDAAFSLAGQAFIDFPALHIDAVCNRRSLALFAELCTGSRFAAASRSASANR